MEQHASLHCFLHVSQYPTPIFVITTAASLLCFLAIAIDTLEDFRQKKLWFPCKYFSLNVATTAVVAMATIPPIFLKSTISTCGDQLEIASCILLSVSMAFFMPSLGGKSRTELTFNLLAVTMVAMTMVVNFFFQMVIGVEFTFFIEYMIIIICIIAQLAVLWSSLLETGIKDVRDIVYLSVTNEHRPSSYEEIRYSLREASKVAHLTNPQYILGRSSNCVLMCFLCGISVTVLLKEMPPSSMLGNSSLCNGVAEYGFSSLVVIAAQTIAIITAAAATTTRWIVIALHVGPERFVTWRDIFRGEQYHLKWWREMENRKILPPGNGFHLKILRVLKGIVFDMVVTAEIDIFVMGKLMCYLSMWFTFMLKKLLNCLGYDSDVHLNDENNSWDYSISSFLGEKDLKLWMLSNWKRDMERREKRYERKFPTHLIQFLSKWEPCRIHPFNNLSSTHLVLVMRIALLQSSHEERNQFLLNAFNQGLEMVHFVEENSGNQSIILKSFVSHILWRNRDNPDTWLNKTFGFSGTGLGSINVMELGTLVQMYREYEECHNEVDMVNYLSEGMEMTLLIDLVTTTIFASSVLEGHDQFNAEVFFEETACQILHSLLRDLPLAIYNEYSRYPFQKCEARIQKAMYFLSMAEKLPLHHINW